MILLAQLLRWAGFGVLGLGFALLLFVAAYPLGLINAYPDLPRAAVEGPLGVDHKIADPQSLYRMPEEPLPDYLDRLTKSVAGGIVHYWTVGDSWSAEDIPYTRISIYDNYLLWIQSIFPAGASLRNYEYVTPAKVIARGYGFCSQVSKLLYSVLRDQGIDATVASNPLHTVVESGGSVLDADYGVFIPHPLAWMRQHPEAVDSYYAAFGWMLPILRQAYGQPWHGLGTPDDYDSLRAYEERFDRLKWLPPLFAMVAGVLLLVCGRLLRRFLSRGGRAMRSALEPRKTAPTL